MGMARAMLKEGGMAHQADAGQTLYSQAIPSVDATAGSSVLTAAMVTSGWLQRSGPAGAFNITWPSADSIILALGDTQVGDQFDFYLQNLVAFLGTFIAGTGIVSGVGTLNVAASTTRLYKMTILSNKPQTILVGNNTNASAILTGFTAAQIATIMPGMGCTGANVQAAAVVLGVAAGDGTADPVTGGKVTLSSNCTGTNLNIPFTFFPQIRLDGLGTLAA